MDSSIDLTNLNIRAIKEPIGFIRILQLVLAILALSTTAGYSSNVSTSINCGGQISKIEKIDYPVKYPFTHEIYRFQICGSEEKIPIEITTEDYSSSPRFVVATSVLCLIYTLIALAIYVLKFDLYSNDERPPIVDLAFSIVFTLFWFCGAIAWASTIGNIKEAYSTKQLEFRLSCSNGPNCHSSDASFATLTISAIFSFTNLLLWAASIWFVYKETKFHKANQNETTA